MSGAFDVVKKLYAFVRLTAAMRDAQKEYFDRGRTQSELRRSRALEAQVDAQLGALLPLVNQKTDTADGSVQLGLLADDDSLPFESLSDAPREVVTQDFGGGDVG